MKTHIASLSLSLPLSRSPPYRLPTLIIRNQTTSLKSRRLIAPGRRPELGLSQHPDLREKQIKECAFVHSKCRGVRCSLTVAASCVVQSAAAEVL